jgi:hypothetical protein
MKNWWFLIPILILAGGITLLVLAGKEEDDKDKNEKYVTGGILIGIGIFLVLGIWYLYDIEKKRESDVLVSDIMMIIKGESPI